MVKCKTFEISNRVLYTQFVLLIEHNPDLCVHCFVDKYAFIISISSANLNNGVTPPMMMYPPLAIIYYLGLFLLHGLNHIHHFSMNWTRTLRYHLLKGSHDIPIQC